MFNSDKTSFTLINANVYSIPTLIQQERIPTSIKRLALHSNKIRRIKGLSSFIFLQELDLSSNCIKKIEGLDTLSQLRDLNLSSNEVCDFIKLLIFKDC